MFVANDRRTNALEVDGFYDFEVMTLSVDL